MSAIQPIENRELLIDDSTRFALRQDIDPLIQGVLSVRGYVEDHALVGHVLLNSRDIQPGSAYLENLGTLPYDGLEVKTTYSVDGDERELTRSEISLRRIGGFGTATLSATGLHYALKKSESEPTAPPETTRLTADKFASILRGVARQIPPFYNYVAPWGPSTPTDPQSVITGVLKSFENLTPIRKIDRRAYFQKLNDPLAGDVRFMVGESFEERDEEEQNGHYRTRRYLQQKMFEISTAQALGGETTVETQALYKSGEEALDIQMKLSAIIHGTDYSDEEKAELYRHLISEYQDMANIRLFGHGIIECLKQLSSVDADSIRV